MWVRVPRLPLTMNGLIVQQEDTGPANRGFGCDSRWVHFFQHHGPVVQRRRLLAYTQATMVRVHPGSMRRRSSGPGTPKAERLGLNPSVCRFDSCSGHKRKARLGRQLADHPRLGLERRMLRVQIPPEPLIGSGRQPLTLARRVQLPQGILGDRLTVGRLPLKQSVKVRFLLPEPF